MTEMCGLGVAQCKKCHYWVNLYGVMGYCDNCNSDHYGHVIMQFHPICANFLFDIKIKGEMEKNEQRRGVT